MHCVNVPFCVTVRVVRNLLFYQADWQPLAVGLAFGSLLRSSVFAFGPGLSSVFLRVLCGRNFRSVKVVWRRLCLRGFLFMLSLCPLWLSRSGVFHRTFTFNSAEA